MSDDALPAKPEQNRNMRGRPFVKGRSGNPAGRPRGIRDGAGDSGQRRLARKLKALTDKAVEQALAGDAAALRLCFDRLVPPRRERAVSLALPPVREMADILPMTLAIAEAVSRGEITPGEAGELGRLVQALVRALETSEFERELRAMKATYAAQGTPS